MVIRKLRASFGCLERAELTLHKGLNVIEMPNGSGKSTWCAFLRCMLYGLDSRRGGKGQMPDKTLYAPWSGAPMEGEAELDWQGERLLLRRSSASAALPMRAVSLTRAEGGEAFEELPPADIGETLTGVSAGVFERTAFIRQPALPVSADGQLDAAVRAALSSGDEQISYADAEARLRAWLRQLRSHNRGRLPEIEEELATLRRERESVRDAHDRLVAKEELLAQKRKALRALQAEQDWQRQLESEDAVQELEELRGALRTKREETAQLQLLARQRRDALSRSVFQGKTPEQCREDTHTLTARPKASWRPAPLWVLGGVALAVTSALGYLHAPLFLLWLTAASTLALWGAAACLEWRKGRRQKEHLRQLQAYQVKTVRELRAALEAYESAWQEWLRAQDAAEGCETEEAALLRLLREKETAFSESTMSAAPPAGDAWQKAREEYERLSEECAQERGRLLSLGDPVVLESRLQEREARLAEGNRRYEALLLAREMLVEAEEKFQQRFSPLLTKKTLAYFRQLTGEPYAQLQLDSQFDFTLRSESETVSHAGGFYSQGTRDQLYLALRLALCDVLLAGDDPCPLILDDALIAFDDEKMGRAMDVLKELGKKRQILLFTCQKREGKYLRKS